MALLGVSHKRGREVEDHDDEWTREDELRDQIRRTREDSADLRRELREAKE